MWVLQNNTLGNILCKGGQTVKVEWCSNIWWDVFPLYFHREVILLDACHFFSLLRVQFVVSERMHGVRCIDACSLFHNFSWQFLTR